MRTFILSAIAACSLTTFGQYTISSIDFTTPFENRRFYTGSDPGSPFGLGVTLNTENSKYQLFSRISAFRGGGTPFRVYQDTAQGNFQYGKEVMYKKPLGDSILTKSYSNLNSGIGLHVGVRRDFELWTVPWYTSAHVGLFAQRYTYELAVFHIINRPDTAIYDDNFVDIKDYSIGTTLDEIKDHGWAIMPQVGLETGLVLSAGDRLQFIPKLIINFSSYRVSGIQDFYADDYMTPEVAEIFVFDLQVSAALQVSYLLNKQKI